MRRAVLASLVGTCLVGCTTVAVAMERFPRAALIVIGVLMVFVLPGFALVCVALGGREWSAEYLLASVGISLAVGVCVAVLLAATRVGLSQESYGVSLGGLTVVLSIGGMYRSRSTRAQQKAEGPSSAQTSEREMQSETDNEYLF